MYGRKQELEARFKELTGTDRAGIMLVLIHGQREEKLFGQIINRYLRKPVLFYGMDQLILKTDEICERIGTPMLSMAPRFCKRGKGTVSGTVPEEKRTGENGRRLAQNV